MPLRIEHERLWKRLNARFKARRKSDTELEDPDYPILLEILVPITNFDDLAKEGKAITKTDDISGGGSTVYFTVPEGKRWTIKMIYKQNSAVAYSVQIFDSSEAVNLNIIPSGTTSVIQHSLDLTLDQSDQIKTSGGGGGDVAIAVAGWVEEEDAF